MARESTTWKHMLYSEIGARVRTKRHATTLSIRDVAAKTGLSYQSVARIEEGEMAPLPFLVAFAQLVKCEIGELVPLLPFTFPRVIDKAGCET